jgi:putative membrane protein
MREATDKGRLPASEAVEGEGQERERAEPDPRLYMAAERTFLAWIRTGIGLMAFGFVVARFSVFLRQLVLFGSHPVVPNGSGLSLWMGILLIAAGVAVLGVAAWKYQSYLRAIDEGRFRSAFGSGFAVSLAVMLAVAGIAMAVFLLGV